MTSYNAADIIIAPFPFTDNDKVKPRPLVAISTQSFNDTHQKLLALMVTTASRTQWPSDVRITDIAACGLPVASFIRMKCFTLDCRLVTKSIGQLKAQDWSAVQRSLHRVIAI